MLSYYSVGEWDSAADVLFMPLRKAASSICSRDESEPEKDTEAATLVLQKMLVAWLCGCPSLLNIFMVIDLKQVRRSEKSKALIYQIVFHS